jgi:phosphoglycerate dehydrogenase-like enzyme
LFLAEIEAKATTNERKRRLADAILSPMGRPLVLVSAGSDLFASFFSARQQRRLSKLFRWNLIEDRELLPNFKDNLRHVEGMITTWDSPRFAGGLTDLAPGLRIIAHCGGEVKSRFARDSFKRITITNAAEPMARATAEMGAAFLIYCARNVDFYRAELRKPSNDIYDRVHLHGSSESLIGQTVGMIGFGRIGRALVELLRGFDMQWMVNDPYAPKGLTKKYPVRFVGLEKVLRESKLLVLTAALTEETRDLLGKENLARLPDGATVVNIARGGLIDLDALRNEVESGRLRCALDVTDPVEPLPVKDSLRDLPGAIVTPHVAGSGRNVRAEIADVVMDDLERFFDGKRVRNRVTTAMLERMT